MWERMNTKIQDIPLDRLPYWVAMAQGWDLIESWDNESLDYWEDENDLDLFYYVSEYNPLTNKAQAFELIEQFEISLFRPEPQEDWWEGEVHTNRGGYTAQRTEKGKTPSEAICRAVIASVFGEYVGAAGCLAC